MHETSTDRNFIQLHGRVAEPAVFSHSNHQVAFYTLPLEVRRLSGAADRLNLMVPQGLLEECGLLEQGTEVTVQGEVRTFNNRSGQGNRLVITVLARRLSRETGEDGNRLVLSGTLCKPPVLRATPLGRTICDLILAVNRRYGRADYLPCIAWGSLAHQCAAMAVGERLALHGRLQSRCYTKTLEGVTQERTAFEVSVMALEEEAQRGEG